ncbi:MAG: YdcF family protein [Gammaproteobacteria bacterium]|nr:YdcF family protein [Gammaproteobacteria bacterium]
MNTNFVWHLVEPSHLLVYGLMLGLMGWRWAWGKRCLWVTAVALIACSILPIGQVLIRPLEQRFPMPEALGKVDGVIVLAGAEMAELTEYYTEPQLNQHADRLTSFTMLAHDFPSARLVHSGGGTGSYNQSDTARAILIGSGIAADRITFEANHATPSKARALHESRWRLGRASGGCW